MKQVTFEKLHDGCINNCNGYCIKWNAPVKDINFRCKNYKKGCKNEGN